MHGTNVKKKDIYYSSLSLSLSHTHTDTDTHRHRHTCLKFNILIQINGRKVMLLIFL